MDKISYIGKTVDKQYHFRNNETNENYYLTESDIELIGKMRNKDNGSKA